MVVPDKRLLNCNKLPLRRLLIYLLLTAACAVFVAYSVFQIVSDLRIQDCSSLTKGERDELLSEAGRVSVLVNIRSNGKRVSTACHERNTLVTTTIGKTSSPTTPERLAEVLESVGWVKVARTPTSVSPPTGDLDMRRPNSVGDEVSLVAFLSKDNGIEVSLILAAP